MQSLPRLLAEKSPQQDQANLGQGGVVTRPFVALEGMGDVEFVSFKIIGRGEFLGALQRVAAFGTRRIVGQPGSGGLEFIWPKRKNPPSRKFPLECDRAQVIICQQ